MKRRRYGLALALGALTVVVVAVWPRPSPPPSPPVFRPSLAAAEDPPVRDNADWNAFCETSDCSEIPEGYTTYFIEPDLYFFPSYAQLSELFPQIQNGFAVPRDHVEWREDGSIRRSYSDEGRLRIRACCNAMLAHFGLIDLDDLSENGHGPGVTGWIRIRSLTYFDLDDHRIGPLTDIVGPETASYTDDFWLLDVGDINYRGYRQFTVLSKEPLLNGYRVLADCSSYCEIRTVYSGADVEGRHSHIAMDLGPHQNVAYGTRSSPDYDYNLFLCEPEALAEGCDPAAPIFDEVTRMIGLLDTMFEMARVHPEGLRD